MSKIHTNTNMDNVHRTSRTSMKCEMNRTGRVLMEYDRRICKIETSIPWHSASICMKLISIASFNIDNYYHQVRLNRITESKCRLWNSPFFRLSIISSPALIITVTIVCLWFKTARPDTHIQHFIRIRWPKIFQRRFHFFFSLDWIVWNFVLFLMFTCLRKQYLPSRRLSILPQSTQGGRTLEWNWTRDFRFGTCMFPFLLECRMGSFRVLFRQTVTAL